jgi:hypothetical protein
MEREGSVDRSPARARRDVEELSIPGAVRVLQPSKNLTVELQYWSTTPTPSNSSSVSIPLGFGGHRDSLTLVHLPHKKRECLFTGPIIDNILQHVSHRDYLSLRLVSRHWWKAVSACRLPRIPAVFYSPTEILQQILNYLSPFDFNSARHTCKAWLIASLDKKLLDVMMKRGGWSKASQEDLLSVRARQDPFLSEEWLISKRLSTECMLSSAWKGHGINVDRLSISTSVDFSDLSTGYGTDGGTAVNFTVSGCGKFVLVTEGCVVYIYQLLDTKTCHPTFTPPLRHLHSLVCPRRVLAVSMDTSAQRFAIAALLEDRMGLVCDLKIVDERAAIPAANSYEPSAIPNVRHTGSKCKHCPPGKKCPVLLSEFADSRGYNVSPEQKIADNPWSDLTLRHNNSSVERLVTEAAWPDFAKNRPPASTAALPQLQSRVPQHFVAIENGARSTYRNLCSTEDPPRSVAICPQRRCVAFGCSAGIELHWVDALTGQDLNRWFPLAAPSDFLHFLPTRRGIDSHKKLRIVSSAAHPNERSSILNRFHPAAHTNPLYIAGGTSVKSVDCDHYRALPLSDGHHMLFTDPRTNILCVGTDAPLGGPNKLSRRIMLIDSDSLQKGIPPGVYSGGADLRWGVRIVATYGNKIVLYSIPSDIFQAAWVTALGTTEDVAIENDAWRDYYGAVQEHGRSLAMGNHNLFPIAIHGVQIGTLDGVVDFAISAGPSHGIWAFCGRKGEATVWDLGPMEGPMNSAMLLSDGAVVRGRDWDGDLHMGDAELPVLKGKLGSFDGAAVDGVVEFPNRSTNVVHSVSGVRYVWPGGRNTFVGDGGMVGLGSSGARGVDEDGDTDMPDADDDFGTPTPGSESGPSLTGANTPLVPDGPLTPTSCIPNLPLSPASPTPVHFGPHIPSLETNWDGDEPGADEWLMAYFSAGLNGNGAWAEGGEERLRVMGFEGLGVEVLG